MGEVLEPVRVRNSFVELALNGREKATAGGKCGVREGFVRCLMC